MTVAGGYAYAFGGERPVAESVEGLVVIDVSPPDPQQVLRTIRVGSGDYRDVAVRNGYAYVADAPEEPYILRTEALTAPKQSTP